MSHRRRAGMYICVLGTSLVVTVIGLSALMAARIQRTASDGSADLSEARSYARSALELGMGLMNSDDAWRTRYTEGKWRINQPIGRGAYSLEIIDPLDDDLADDPSGHVIATGTGTVGRAEYVISVELAPENPPGIDALASSLHASGAVTINDLVSIDAPLSSNLTILVEPSAVVNGDLEAVGLVTILGTVNGSRRSGIAPKEEPQASAFGFYVADGVEIDISAIPGNDLQDALLSPASNPFGAATHSQGIYVIDCKGGDLKIENSRILGTLVLLSAGNGSRIEKGVRMDPVAANLPALMVDGDMEFSWDGSLAEGGDDKINYNPPGSPYDGQTDGDWTDTYPSGIGGLVYVAGDLKIDKPARIEGVVLCAGLTCDVDDDLTIIHDARLIQDPPPGFERQNRPMIPVAGTWRRVVN